MFKKGHKKTGGRKKGTPNKRTITVMERLEGVDIIGSLLDIAKSTSDLSLSASIYQNLMKYVYPQRKAVDVTASNTDETSTQILFLKHLKNMAIDEK